MSGTMGRLSQVRAYIDTMKGLMEQLPDLTGLDEAVRARLTLVCGMTMLAQVTADIEKLTGDKLLRMLVGYTLGQMKEDAPTDADETAYKLEVATQRADSAITSLMGVRFAIGYVLITTYPNAEDLMNDLRIVDELCKSTGKMSIDFAGIADHYQRFNKFIELTDEASRLRESMKTDTPQVDTTATAEEILRALDPKSMRWN